MERFGMSLKKARRQPAELLQLIEYESYGYKRDEIEKLNEQERQINNQKGG